MLHVQTITFGPTSLAVASSQREPAEKRRPWPFNLWTLANARNDAAGGRLASFHGAIRRIEHVRRRGELPEAAIPCSDGLWTETWVTAERRHRAFRDQTGVFRPNAHGVDCLISLFASEACDYW